MDVIQKIFDTHDGENDFFSDPKKNKEILKWFLNDIAKIKEISLDVDVIENHVPETDYTPKIMDEPTGDVVIKKVKYAKDDSYLGLNSFVWEKTTVGEKIKTLAWFQEFLAQKFNAEQVPIYLSLDTPVSVINDTLKNFEDYNPVALNKTVSDSENVILINPKYIEYDGYIPYEISKEIVSEMIDCWIYENKEEIKSQTLNNEKQKLLNHVVPRDSFNSLNEYKERLELIIKNVETYVDMPEESVYLESELWSEDELDKIGLEEEDEKKIAVYGNQPLMDVKLNAFNFISEYFNASQDVLKTKDYAWIEYKNVINDLHKVYDKFFKKHYPKFPDKNSFYGRFFYRLEEYERKEKDKNKPTEKVL